MSEDTVIVKTTVDAPSRQCSTCWPIPTTHQAIDGTGWVRESLDGEPLDRDRARSSGSAMYHDNHPDEELRDGQPGRGVRPAARRSRGSPVRTRSTPTDRRELEFGGWIVALRPRARRRADRTDVTLTYDWSAVPPELREHIQFPPFDAAAPRELAGDTSPSWPQAAR